MRKRRGVEAGPYAERAKVLEDLLARSQKARTAAARARYRGELVLELRGVIAREARRYGGGADLVQLATLAVLEALPFYVSTARPGTSQLPAFAASLARRVVRRHVWTSSGPVRRPRPGAQCDRGPTLAISHEDAAELREDRPDPEGQAVASQTRRQLAAALEVLPREARIAVERHVGLAAGRADPRDTARGLELLRALMGDG